MVRLNREVARLRVVDEVPLPDLQPVDFQSPGRKVRRPERREILSATDQSPGPLKEPPKVKEMADSK